MQATATVHIPQDVHSLYHAHSAASFDAAPRIPPARIHDLPVAVAQHRMPPPPPPPQQNNNHSQQSGPSSSTHAAASVVPAPAASQPSAPSSRVDKVGIPAMTSDGVVLVDDPLSRCVYLSYCSSLSFSLMICLPLCSLSLSSSTSSSSSSPSNTPPPACRCLPACLTFG